MEPLFLQDDSDALVRVAVTHSCDSSQRASKLSAEERSLIQRAALKFAVWLCETIGIGIQTKSAEGAKLIHIMGFIPELIKKICIYPNDIMPLPWHWGISNS